MSIRLLLAIPVLLLLSCGKKDEVIIEKESITSPVLTVETEGDTVAFIEGRPLIELSREDTLKILVRADGAPGMWLGDDGDVHGFYVDLEKMVMKKMGQNYRFVPYYDIGPAALALKSGTHHSALAVPDVPDYRSMLNLTLPYEIITYVTYVQKDDTLVGGDTKEKIINSFHGKRVGVQTLGHIYQILRDIKEIELVEYPTTTKAMEALNRGDVHVVPENRETGEYYAKKNGWQVKQVGGVILSYKNTTGFSRIYDTGVIERYNKALQNLINDGSVVKLWESYYGPMPAENRPF